MTKPHFCINCQHFNIKLYDCEHPAITNIVVTRDPIFGGISKNKKDTYINQSRNCNGNLDCDNYKEKTIFQKFITFFLIRSYTVN